MKSDRTKWNKGESWRTFQGEELKTEVVKSERRAKTEIMTNKLNRIDQNMINRGQQDINRGHTGKTDALPNYSIDFGGSDEMRNKQKKNQKPKVKY